MNNSIQKEFSPGSKFAALRAQVLEIKAFYAKHIAETERLARTMTMEEHMELRRQAIANYDSSND